MSFPIKVTSKAMGCIAAFLVFAAFLSLYVKTGYRGVAPGQSAEYVASIAGLSEINSEIQAYKVETRENPSFRSRRSQDTSNLTKNTVTAKFRTRHLVWGRIGKLLCRAFPDAEQEKALNLLSALFGALSVSLAFAAGRALSLFLNFFESPISARQRKKAAFAAGIAGALALGGSAPFWLASTRCMPAAFDVFLILSAAWLLLLAAVRKSEFRLFVFGIVSALVFFETDAGPYLFLLLAFFAVRVVVICGLSDIRTWFKILIGFSIAAAAYLVLSSGLLGTGVFHPMRELGNSLSIASSLIFSGGLFEDQYRLSAAFFAVAPLLGAILLAILTTHDKTSPALGFLVFIICAAACVSLSNLSISPWGACKNSLPGHIAVLPSLFVAAVVSSITSFGAMSAGGRLFAPGGKRRRTDDEEEDTSGDAFTGRLLFAGLMLFSLVSFAIGYGETKNSGDAFIEKTAEEFASRMPERLWLASTTDALDTMIEIKARQMGKSARIIPQGSSGESGIGRNLVESDEAFRGLGREKLLSSLLSTNVNDFVLAWIGEDRNIAHKLILDSPHLWEQSGRGAIPALIGYRTMTDAEKEGRQAVDWEKIANEHILFWDTLIKADSRPASKYIEQEKGRIKACLCRIGENLAGQLLKQDKHAAKAREVLDKIEYMRH